MVYLSHSDCYRSFTMPRRKVVAPGMNSPREIFAITDTPVGLKVAAPDEFPGKVARPKYSVLENRALKSLGLNAFKPWQDALPSTLRIESNHHLLKFAPSGTFVARIPAKKNSISCRSQESPNVRQSINSVLALVGPHEQALSPGRWLSDSRADFACFFDAAHCVGVASGTDAVGFCPDGSGHPAGRYSAIGPEACARRSGDIRLDYGRDSLVLSGSGDRDLNICV